MLLAMKIKAAIDSGRSGQSDRADDRPCRSAPRIPTITEIAAKPFQYRPAGDFSRDGRPADAPLRETRLATSIKIMNRQVTAGEYARCVDDGGCPENPARLRDRQTVRWSA